MSNSSTSRKRKQDQPGRLHAGVDLALEKNVVVVIDEKGERLDHFDFVQDRGGYDYFLQRLERLRQKQQGSEVVVAMEPSNYIWKLLARELEEKKITYHLVNAYTVKKHREGNQIDLSKDDRRDARQIAELSRNGHYTETHLQKGAYEELRQYATLYTQCVQALRREEQVLWALVGQAFPELTQVFKDLGGKTSRALLMSNACAAHIRQMTESEFVAKVKVAYPGKNFSPLRVRQAYRLAATSIGVTEGLQAIQLAIQLHFSHLRTLQIQLEQVAYAMTTTLASLPEAPYLLSVPSMKSVSVALFLAEVGDPKRYRTAAEWVKLAGVQPMPNISGKKQRSKTPMSHHGRARLRTLVYFICLRMIRKDPHFAELYSHLQRRPKNPLTKMQALGVLMNKLLHILWALVHNQTRYNPSFAQPI